MLLKKSGEAHIEKVDGCSDCGSSEVEGNMEKSKIEKKHLEKPLEITYPTFQL